MKRKINLVGQNTLTVSLPSKWAKKHEIKKGDEIEVYEEKDRLIFLSQEYKKKPKNAVINLDEFSLFMLKRHLSVFYRQGVEEIVMKYTKKTIYDYKTDKEKPIYPEVKKLTQRFIGMEIISHTDKKIVLESLISREEINKIDMIQKRVVFLIKEFLNEFIQAMDKDFSVFHKQSYDYHDNIAKFYYYYLRLLKFSDIEDSQKNRLSELFIVLDKIVDKVRHTAERMHEMKKITPKIKKYIKLIFNIFMQLFNALTTKKHMYTQLDEVVEKRYSLVKQITKEKFNESELRVLTECKIMLDTINDFYEAHVTLHSEKYIEE